MIISWALNRFALDVRCKKGRKRNRIKAVTVMSEAGCLQSNSNFLLSRCKCSQLCFILFYFPSHFRIRLRGLQKVAQKISLYMKTRTWTTAQSRRAAAETTSQSDAAVLKVDQSEEGIMRNSPDCWTVRWVCAPTSLVAAHAPSALAL